ncbi:MAG: sensor histidine kinase [Gemmatimonadota bacterium]
MFDRYQRPYRSRSAFIVSILVVALVLVAALAYQAQDAARSHREVAERAMREHAATAAWEFASYGRQFLDGKLLHPGLDATGRYGGKEPAARLGPADSLARLWIESGASEEPRPRFHFRLALPARRLTTAGRGSPGPALRRLLTDSVVAHMSRAYDPDLQHAVLLATADGRDHAVAYAAYPGPGSSMRTIYGFVMDAADLAYTFRKVLDERPLLAPSLTGGAANAEMLAVRVTTPVGDTLLHAGRDEGSPFAARDTLGAAFGGIGVEVAIRPEAAETLVIGGLPRSRMPLLIGLLVLTVGLVAAAIFQLRREQELARLRSDFVSGVSHELRTPLAQIRMFGETLLLDRVRNDDERRRSLEIIVQEAVRLSHLVGNVLHFSRAERGAADISPRPTAVASTIRDVVESFRPLAAARDTRVEVDVDDRVLAPIDPVAFRQMLLNLMDNAVKYGRPGGTVRVSAAVVGDRLRVRVDDDGPGVPPGERETIWAPFARLKRDRDSAVAGTGVGLAVVRMMAQQHGGRARAASSPAGGARFVIELPGAERRGAGSDAVGGAAADAGDAPASSGADAEDPADPAAAADGGARA